jgi:hypothetical protein
MPQLNAPYKNTTYKNDLVVGDQAYLGSSYAIKDRFLFFIVPKIGIFSIVLTV